MAGIERNSHFIIGITKLQPSQIFRRWIIVGATMNTPITLLFASHGFEWIYPIVKLQTWWPFQKMKHQHTNLNDWENDWLYWNPCIKFTRVTTLTSHKPVKKKKTCILDFANKSNNHHDWNQNPFSSRLNYWQWYDLERVSTHFAIVIYLLRVSLTGSTYLWGTPRGGEYPSG